MNVFSEERLKQTREAMAGAGADALVLTHLPNIFYLAGFSGSNAVLLVFGDAAHLFTDGRYTIQAREEAPETHHDHLIDMKTGKVVEFVDEEIEALQAAIAKKLGYRLVDHRLELYGVPVEE